MFNQIYKKYNGHYKNIANVTIVVQGEFVVANVKIKGVLIILSILF
jgi:hypothetical protein